MYQKSLMSEGQIFGIFMELWGVVVASAICTFKFVSVKGRRRQPNFKGLKLNYTASGVGLGEYERIFFFPNDEKKDYSVISTIMYTLSTSLAT